MSPGLTRLVVLFAAVALGLSAAALAVSLSRGGTSTVVHVPNVVGKPLNVAEGFLTGLGLKYHVVNLNRTSASPTPPARVLAETPFPNALIEPGANIKLDVFMSLQPRHGVVTRVPLVLGMTMSTALHALTKLGLTYRVVYVPRSSANALRPGIVIAETPDAGNYVPHGTAVQVKVVQVPVRRHQATRRTGQRASKGLRERQFARAVVVVVAARRCALVAGKRSIYSAEGRETSKARQSVGPTKRNDDDRCIPR